MHHLTITPNKRIKTARKKRGQGPRIRSAFLCEALYPINKRGIEKGTIMWRAHFYEKSLIGKWVYKPMATLLWVGFLLGAAYNHATQGTIQPWALFIVVLGFILFLVAKIQVLKSGKLISFGADLTSNQPWQITLPYAAGYILMLTGFILSFR
ncbi:MAG: hypothetical protein KZQ90_09210 [Candidatus Thiodiazotropha sp. (ex Codakia rugifera)]|nr:hypothetical protein [Candidatus Thiodiazotropha sp. (ex Codakia rugifera)]